MNKKSLILIVVGSLIFPLYLYFVVGIDELIDTFTKINPYSYLPYYAAALAATILSALFYSMSWERLMRATMVKVSLKKAFVYSWLGNFVDLVIPFETISGEITRIYLVQRDTGEQPGRIVASIVAHRTITTLMVLCSLSVSSIILLMEYNISAAILYLLLATIFGSLILISLLILLSLKKEITEKIVNFSLRIIAPLFERRVNLPSIRDKVYQNLVQFHDGFKSFGRNRRALAEATIYGFFAWLLHLSVHFLVFYALGFSEIITKFYEVIIIYSLSSSTQSIPIALPLGLVEMVMMSLYTLFGIPISLSGIATLFIRVATFWLNVISGYVIAELIGVKNLLNQSIKNTST